VVPRHGRDGDRLRLSLRSTYPSWYEPSGHEGRKERQISFPICAMGSPFPPLNVDCRTEGGLRSVEYDRIENGLPTVLLGLPSQRRQSKSRAAVTKPMCGV
jgi:hypothetical protein